MQLEADSKQQKKEIDDMQEPDVNDDQINPYHGDLKPPPETEPLDLPEEMQLDEGDVKEENAEESNPFDVDTMKGIYFIYMIGKAVSLELAEGTKFFVLRKKK